MKSKRLFLLRWITIFGVTICATSFAQPRFGWANAAGGGSTDEGRSVAADADGNIYITGHFYSDLNLGTTNISSGAGCCTYDIFVAKYTAQGALLWARAAGSPNGHDYGRAIATDAEGNAYITGAFVGNARFSSTNLSSHSGNEDIFVAKYDRDGELIWVKQFGGSNTDHAYGIANDLEGNIYVVAYFYGTGTFGNTSLSSLGDADTVLLKLSSSGELIRASHLRGTGTDLGSCVATFADGSVIIGGHFSGTLFHDERCIVSQGSYDAFLARFSASGEMLWFRQAGGNNPDFAQGIAADRNGDVVLTGQFQGTASFGSTNLNSIGNFDIFVSRYDASGNLRWVQQAGSSYWENGYDVDLDEQGNAYVTGAFQYSMQISATNLSSVGNEDVFLAKYASDGALRWAIRAGSGSTDYGFGVSVRSNSMSIVGFFHSPMTFGTASLSGYGSPDIFVAQFNADLPEITLHPSALTVMEGASVTLTVGYIGTQPITNQWLKNGLPLGEFSPALNLTNVTPSDSGLYSVIVGNYEGSVMSTQAQLIVNTIRDSVDNTTVPWTSGGNAAWFSQTEFTHDGVDALRSGAISHGQQSWVETTLNGPVQVRFYWRISCENGYDFLRLLVNGVEVTNTSGKIDWKPVQVNVGAGPQTLRWVYSKDDSESVGQDAGWVDEVFIIQAPSIISGPASQTVVAGMTATLSVTNSGTPPFAYEWLHNGAPLAGADGPVLTLSNVSPDASGTYRVRISNPGGLVTSADAVLTVQIPPLITLQPLSHTVRQGSDVLLEVRATGQEPLTYQWTRNGVPLAGATNATLRLINVAQGQSGSYSVTVISSTGSSVSQAALLTVINLYMLPAILIDGVVGRRYDILFKNDLRQTNWTSLTNVTLIVSPSWHVDHSAAGSPHRFYQVVPAE